MAFAVFQELEFERGIWSAAMDGEQKKVEKLLQSGVCPSATDSSGYTALVSNTFNGFVFSIISVLHQRQTALMAKLSQIKCINMYTHTF